MIYPIVEHPDIRYPSNNTYIINRNAIQTTQLSVIVDD